MNDLQNIFRRLLNTSLYHRVKHKSFKENKKNIAIALPLLENKAVNSTIFKIL